MIIGNGPEVFKSDEQGNVSGDGSGFLVSWEEGLSLDLELTGTKKFDRERPFQDEQRRRWLDLMCEGHK